MKFGIWYHLRNPERWKQPAQDLYRKTLDQIVAAEKLGYDSVWVSEHHFTDDGYLPSSLLFLAAVAARTTRIRLGTLILLLPLHHPLRVAEDAAVLDILSNGRVDLGVAAGYRVEEFEAFEVPHKSGAVGWTKPSKSCSDPGERHNSRRRLPISHLRTYRLHRNRFNRADRRFGWAANHALRFVVPRGSVAISCRRHRRNLMWSKPITPLCASMAVTLTTSASKAFPPCFARKIPLVRGKN